MGILLLGFVSEKLTETQLNQIRDAAPDMQIVVTRDRDEIESMLDKVEIAVGGFPHDLISKAHNLRWLQQWGAGADWLMRYPEVIDQDFVLTNVSGVHPIPISEHIFALLLAFARDLHSAIRAQSQRHWKGAAQSELFELIGKTMLLIGVGAIGKRTAKIAAALEMRVLGVRRNPTMTVPTVETMFGPDQLLDILPEADFVVLTAPLTHETEKMIGERELRAMKPTAYLVNIGRGGTIDENALIHVLREGWIAGAGLDVFEIEPLPEDSPLWGMENVIITAHYSGLTPHYDERAMGIFLKNLKLYQAGKPLINVIAKKLGY
jgi:phosphoglycerate dehydrogenase-like enzyme